MKTRTHNDGEVCRLIDDTEKLNYVAMTQARENFSFGAQLKDTLHGDRALPSSFLLPARRGGISSL